MLKAIIFDFDGIICESVDVKVEAFRKLFSGHPKHLKKIIDYHIRAGGISRYEKFKVIYRDILRKKLTPEKSAELGKKFTAYAYAAVIASPLVEGAQELLSQHYKKILFFIASGTPQEEVASIIQKKKLDKFFKGVYGSPQTKYEIIAKVLKKNKIDRDSIIFVGDSINDYDGARQAGIKFVGRIRKGHPNPFVSVKMDGLIRDMSDLQEWLKVRKLIT